MNICRRIITVLLSAITLTVGIFSVYIEESVTRHIVQTFDIVELVIPVLLKILFFVFLWLDGIVAMRYAIVFSDEQQLVRFLLITQVVVLACGVLLTTIISIFDFHLRIDILRLMIPFATVKLLTIGWLGMLKKYL